METLYSCLGPIFDVLYRNGPDNDNEWILEMGCELHWSKTRCLYTAGRSIRPNCSACLFSKRCDAKWVQWVPQGKEFIAECPRKYKNQNATDFKNNIHICLKYTNNVDGESVSETFFLDLYIHVTSSTAQGGGRSFKNRKPIGEVGCCESGMAERSHCWSERWLISLTISLSFSDYLPTYPPTYLSIYLCIYRSIYLPTYLSIYLTIYLSPSHLSICLAVYLSICLSIYLSVCLSVYLSICGAVSFSVM